MPDSLRPYLIAAGVLIAAAVGFVALAGGFKARPLTVAEKHARRAHVGGPFPLELRSPQVVAGTSERVMVALGRPSLGELVAKSPQTPVQQRAYVRSLDHEATALMSALNAKGIRFGHPVLFARVWAGFAATLATKDLPAVQTLGLRVEPVTRFYPAQVAAKSAPSVRPLPTTAAAKTRVAVLDAFPRRWERSYSGPLGVSTAELAPSVDVVGAPGAPRLPAERGGFRLESVVRAELPKARTYIVRTAGSQPLENGSFETYATTDQLLRALEWVVDPNRNGDSRDAMPVALTGLSAPYSGFSDGPSAEAADAAAALGTLVVAPAGNGGRGSGPFGSIGAPAAAPSALAVGALDGSGNPAPASSRGPTYELGPKPDLAMGGGARTAAGTAWGTAIAAARAAGVAAALRAERPALTPAEAAAALVGTAASRGSALAAGGGDPLLQAARATPLVALPWSLALGPGSAGRVTIVNLSGTRQRAGRMPIAPHGSARLAVSPLGTRGSGRAQAGPIAVPFAVVAAQPPPPPLGPLAILHRSGRPDGVRFTAGSISRGAQGTGVVPVGNLVLTLEGPGRRELTPPGGARDLLPGEYAYTLTREILGSLPPGRYRFVVRARGTAGGAPVVRRSRSFRIG